MLCDFNLTVERQGSLSLCSPYVAVLSKFTIIAAMVSVILCRYLEEGQGIRKPGHQMQMDYQLQGTCALLECRPILWFGSVQRLRNIKT